MNKEGRILSLLQKAKDKGVPETELFNDWETSNVIRVTKHRLKKIAQITIKDGIWILDKSYWDTTPVEFRDMIIMHELSKCRKVVLYSFAIAIIIAIALGVVLGLTLELELLYA